jgi:hypothetical protein
VRVLAWIAVAGCGRIAFDVRPPDGSPAPPDVACTWTAFSAPQPLLAIVQSPVDDWFPMEAAGELYFYSYRGANVAEIYHAPIAPFGAPVVESELAQGTNDIKWPAVSDDGLVIIYGAYDGTYFHLWQGTRAAPGDVFSSLAPLAVINSSVDDYAPSLSADGLRLVFGSDRSGPQMLYETSRPDRASPFAPPQAHPELDLMGAGSVTSNGTLSPDALDVWYAAFTTTDFQVYTAHRSAPDQMFSTPHLVPELSSAMDDLGLHLSADGTTMFLDYDTHAPGGQNSDMWSATRACL